MADHDVRFRSRPAPAVDEMGVHAARDSSRVLLAAAIIAAFLALAALGTTAWLFVDRQQVAEELVSARVGLQEREAELAAVREERDELRRRLSEERRGSGRLAAAAVSCLEAMEGGVALYNALAEELGAVASLDQAGAREFFERARELARDANRSLRRCRQGVG